MNTESAQYSQDHPEKTNLSSAGAEADFRQKTLARTDQQSTDGTLTSRLAGQGSRVKQGKQQAGGMVGGEQGASVQMEFWEGFSWTSGTQLRYAQNTYTQALEGLVVQKLLVICKDSQK